MGQAKESTNKTAFPDDRTLLFFSLTSSRQTARSTRHELPPTFSGLASAELGREAKMTKQMGLLFSG